MDVLALVGDLAALDAATANREQLDRGVETSSRLRAWLDGIDVDLAEALRGEDGLWRQDVECRRSLSLAAGHRVIERGETLRVLPALEAAMKAGDVSAAHVDVAVLALRQVPEARRGELAAIIDRRVSDAWSLPANEYEKRLRVEVESPARRR